MGFAFIDALQWHYSVFMLADDGQVWRVWFDGSHQPCMECLLGHEAEWREPVKELKGRQPHPDAEHAPQRASDFI